MIVAAGIISSRIEKAIRAPGFLGWKRIAARHSVKMVDSSGRRGAGVVAGEWDKIP